MFRYEHRTEKPISKSAFIRRLGHSFLVVCLLIGVSLGLGMLGYSYFEGLSWTDSFLNAAMILGGMGPVDPMRTEAGKLFAGGYALYSGLAFLVLAGLLFGPVAHRILHRFHYESEREEDAGHPPALHRSIEADSLRSRLKEKQAENPHPRGTDQKTRSSL